VLRLAGLAAVVLLLDLLQPRLDVLVADLDAHLGRLLLVLARRDQELGRVRAEVGQVHGPRLREGVVERHVIGLRLSDQLVPGSLRNRLVADHGDRVGRDRASPAAAASGNRENQDDP